MDKSQRFANILFDLDGTLTDPALGITSAVQYALRKMGIEVEDITTLNWMIGPPLLTSFKEGYGMSDDDAKRALGYYREYFSVTGIYQNEIYPGIAELLRDLHSAGRRILLATSKPEEFAKIILKHFDIYQYFALVGGNTFEETRPKKEDVVDYVLSQYPDITPDNTVMVGDRKYDVEGSSQFGLECIGVLFGYGSREELEEAGAAYIAATVDELKSILL